MPKKKPSKRSIVLAARREYSKLTRAYHSAGKRAMGKPERSTVKKDYRKIQRARDLVGRRLGKLTGVHKGR
jgi:hypothetical protein